MGKVTMESQHDVNFIVSHLPGVKNAVHDAADEIANKADAKLAMHHDTGKTHVEVDYLDTDAIVSLVDDDRDPDTPAVAAIEYGHTAPNGRWVPGLHLITNVE
jgi:hypothetical protein